MVLDVNGFFMPFDVVVVQLKLCGRHPPSHPYVSALPPTVVPPFPPISPQREPILWLVVLSQS